MNLIANIDFIGTISNISVKKGDNAVTYQNIAQDVRDTYTLVDGDWLGDELVVNGDFATDTDWTKDPLSSGTPWVISGGVASIDGTQTSASDIFQTTAMVQDNRYTLSFGIQSTTGNVTVARTGGLSIPATSFSTVGLHTLTYTLDAASSPTAFRCLSGIVASIDNVSVKEVIEVADFIEPVTQGMTLTEAWTTRGIAYGTLQNATSASVRVDATISNTDDGILMEMGADAIGLMLYVYSGVLYFQCGDGSAYGTASNRAEVSYTLPVGEADYIIEWSADTSNAVLYVNGLRVGSQTFSEISLAGTNFGTVGEVQEFCAINRGGWTIESSGVYTNTITKCDIFNNQITSDV